MGACTAFIFAALIEFTVVNYLWRKWKLATYGFDFRVDYDNENSNGHTMMVVALASTVPETLFSSPWGFLCCLFFFQPGHHRLLDGEEDSLALRSIKTNHGRSNNDQQPGTKNNQEFYSEEGCVSTDDSGGDGIPDQTRRLPRLPTSTSLSVRRSPLSLGLRVDEACRILFPLNFLCFNIFYWWYYLY